ncbi:hypothetical protein PROFUN_12765 [Planoprotostelium fungivorum]|uniref:Uncharacterized protein n=1 Tax=Planoprotostelium fungivorum TaxID=1890364 RepID=A0A2P6N5K6_9EUKA|nr:hypothetical protein PROFUN_12765 [Planoprotostelium fungivorum]
MDKKQFDRRLQHLISISNELQQTHGNPSTSSEVLAKMRISPRDRMKDMNLDGAYLKDGRNFRNQREFVQNFVDQCRLLNRGMEPHMTYEQIPSQMVNGDGINIWRLYSSAEQILGCICEIIVASVPVHTTLKNYNTVLDPVILAIGRSAGAVGHFGEGMKVTINRFTDAGYLVYYHTGCTQWSFSYNESRILHAHFTQIPPRPHTTVTIQVPHSIFQTGANLSPIDINEYLTLNPHYQATCEQFWFNKNIILIPIAKITALSASKAPPGQGPDQMAGGIYVRGIQIAKSDHGAAKGTSLGFAINFIGSTDQYEAIGLRRDRDHVNVDKIVQMIRGLLIEGYRGNQDVQDEICRFICSHVEAQPSKGYPKFITAMLHKSQHAQSESSEDVLFSDIVCDFFNRSLRAALGSGNKAVLPYKKGEEKDKDEAEYLQCKASLVSDHLYSLVEPSRHMVTLEKLWASKREDLWKLPEAVPKSEAEKKLVDGLVGTVKKCYFNSPEEEFTIVFKVFPHGNQLLVIDIPVTDDQGKILRKKPKIWIVDYGYLNRTEMVNLASDPADTEFKRRVKHVTNRRSSGEEEFSTLQLMVNSLYFNLRYYQVLHLNATRGKAKCWWLVTFAHEVPHNVAAGHNKQHEFLEEMILQEHMFKLFNKWDN